MKRLLIASIVFTVFFAAFSFFVRDTQTIWLETRIFGLFSFFVLFLAVSSGELMKLKSRIATKIHKPISLLAVFLVILHFISAILDKYKWGKSVSLVQFLGFSLSSSWLFYLSLGTIAMYLMLLIGLTSQPRVISFVGAKVWRLIHIFAYLAFFIAYIHSVKLGTDLKVTAWAPYFLFAVHASALIVVALLLTRVLSAFKLLDNKWDSALSFIFFILMIISIIMLGVRFVKDKDAALSEQNAIALEEKGIAFYDSQLQKLTAQVEYYKGQMELMRNGSS